LHPGDKKAEERFKEIAAANDILSDPDKRARYDRGEIDASGQERAPGGFYRDFAQGPDGGKYYAREGFETSGEFEDFLSGLFGGRGPGGTHGGTRTRARGIDTSYTVEIEFRP
jgi:DnaJ-class molecular chaperone